MRTIATTRKLDDTHGAVRVEDLLPGAARQGVRERGERAAGDPQVRGGGTVEEAHLSDQHRSSVAGGAMTAVTGGS